MKNETNHQSIENDYINDMLNGIGVAPETETKTAVETVNDTESTSVEEVNFDVRSNIDTEIDCEVFKVAGLSIALPVSFISANLIQADINVTDAHGLRVGEVVVDGDVIDVIDLTYFIMKAVDSDASALNENSKKVDVFLLKNTNAAILFEEDVGIKTIVREKVCWRSGTSNRAWLAGTVREHGCCLLDLVAIMDYLKNDS